MRPQSQRDESNRKEKFKMNYFKNSKQEEKQWKAKEETIFKRKGAVKGEKNTLNDYGEGKGEK